MQRGEDMSNEIERNYLVRDDRFLCGRDGVRLTQGYIPGRQHAAARVRISGERGFITFKGEATGISRREFEYEIPLVDAEEMLQLLCEKPFIEKMRYEIEHAGSIWEVDVFGGDNEGLVVAEIELEREDQEIDLPPWLGDEVSGDERYFNASLAIDPYKNWRKS
jgi:adenylate cyclase